MEFQQIVAYKGCLPEISEDAFVAQGAILIGRVSLGAQSSVFYGSVLRADINSIVIGQRTNIQDNCTIHLSDRFGVEVGDDCTIGHNVVLHACKVGSRTTIGMGAIVMDGAEIGEESLVAAGALVPPGKVYPPRSLILGNPARVIRTLTDDDVEANVKMAQKYLNVVREHQKSLKESSSSVEKECP